MDKSTERLILAAGGDFSIDQAEFTTPGTYSLTVPPNVTSMSFVAIGGGQGGAVAGGEGGSLRYLNNVSVTPNEVLTITVGAGGAGGPFNLSNSSTKGSFGGESSVKRGSTVLVNSTAGAGVGFSGGSGGTGVANQYGDGGGGGGAAGYAGNGGIGASNGQPGTAGNGGAGGGGGITVGSWDSYPYKFGIAGGQGGGTELKGQGASGAAPVSRTASGTIVIADKGKTGSSATGGDGYGAGGGGGYGVVNMTDGSQTLQQGFAGQSGAVRAIWPGNVRQFPSTRTADE